MQGGVGDYTNELSKALAALGIEVHVITSKSQHAARNTQHATRITHHASHVAQHAPILHRVVEKWNWDCWRAIAGIVQREQPDVLHIQYQAAAYAMHPAINFLPWRLRWSGVDRPRTAVTLHDLRVPYLFPKAGPLRWQVVLALARGADAVIATNEGDREVLRRELGGTRGGSQELGGEPPGHRLFLIPIGSNIKPVLPAGYDRAAQRARWGVGPDGILLCHFGFMNERKGIETLLHALKALTGEASPAGDLRLLMIGGKVGSSDPTNVAYLRRVEGLIAGLGLAERVLWTGFVSPEEVSASFAAADVCVLPYREGASFQHGTLMAALAHGMPIVTTYPNPKSKIPSPKELRDRENVALVSPDDPQALAAAIRELAGSPELRRRLGEGARELSRLFDWQCIAAQHLEVYRALA
ncbi:MAG: glycosyltransferase family 4 protein [Anaerolineae bacterium]|nr:glycosyltransferase family 4 protein [Anaerolineae bacterium]